MFSDDERWHDVDHGADLAVGGGANIVVFGLSMLGVLRIGALLLDTRIHLDIPGGHPWGVYLLSLAFAFGWTPCIGLILGAILTVGATTTRATEGIWLLSIYSARLSVPFLLTAVFTDTIAHRIGEIWSSRPYALQTRWRSHGAHGDCHHDQATRALRLLAACDVSCPWENRLAHIVQCNPSIVH